MGKRGPKPKGKVKIKWSADFAYAVGLIASDGYVSKNGRHVALVSKDKDQIDNFLKALDINAKIGVTSSGYKDKTALRVQFSDAVFHKFLFHIGIMPAKSKILGEIYIPQNYFFDFLRGVFDGDGCFYSYWDPRWRSSFMFYTEFVSASRDFINWVRFEIFRSSGIKGHLNKAKRDGSCYQLKYAKSESLVVLRAMYYKNDVMCLSRKKLKIQKALGIIGEQLFV